MLPSWRFFAILVCALLFLGALDSQVVKAADNGKTSMRQTSKSSSSSKETKASTSSLTLQYDFIFGFSTGHVGTTTLSEGKLYGKPEKVAFLHEAHYGRIPLEDIFDTKRYLNSTFEDQYAYVRDVYMPFLKKMRKKSKTLLDLGHNINYFIQPLITYLINETKYKFIFVRIRRQRHEAAISLTYRHPDQKHDIHICESLVTRFCPLERQIEVALPLPHGEDTWDSFTNNQRALWITDETEARWQRILKVFPSLDSIEVLWGKQWPGSIERAAAKIGKLIGVTEIVPFDPTWDHMEPHQHAGEVSAETDVLFQLAEEDRAYSLEMKFPYQPA